MRGAPGLAAAAGLAALLLASLLAAAPAAASSGGRSGRSGRQGPTCNECHDGGLRPDVAFALPAVVHAGESVVVRFTVHAGSPAGKAAGFNVAVEGGTLATIAGQGTHLANGEITHSEPQDNDAGRNAGWDFRWIAPATPGRYRLWGAGNSVNLNGQSSGDRADAVVLRVDVVAADATPTPTTTAAAASETATDTATATPAFTTVPPTDAVSFTPTPSPTPDPTDTATPSATDTPTASPTPPTVVVPCPGDCNGDGTVAINELVIAVSIALDTQPLTTCALADLNGDQRVAINELITLVNNALSAC